MITHFVLWCYLLIQGMAQIHRSSAFSKRQGVTNISKSTNTSMLGNNNRTAWLIHWEFESMNHHCRGRISEHKFREDNAPRSNHEKISKINLEKIKPQGLYLGNYNLLTPLTLRKRSHHRTDSRRSLIVHNVIFIDAEEEKIGHQNLN
jgi:hypothetical protein